MTRRINLKGSRLGISNKWLTQSQSLNYSDLISIHLFIQNFIKGFFKKWNIGILFLDIKIEQGTVFVDVIIQHKFWSDLRKKRRNIKKRRFTKKQRKNHKRLYYIRKKFLNKFFDRKNRSSITQVVMECYNSYVGTAKFFQKLSQYKENIFKIDSLKNKYNNLGASVVYKKFLLFKILNKYWQYRKDSQRTHAHYLKLFNKHYNNINLLRFNSIIFNKILKLFLERQLKMYLRNKYSVNINLLTTKELLKYNTYVTRNAEFLFEDSRFHKYKKWYGENFLDYLIILNLGLYYQNPQYIADFIAFLFKYNRRHSSICYMVFDILNVSYMYYSRVQSLKLKVSGRFHGKLRKEKRILQTESSLCSQTLSKPLDYGFSEAFTYCGVFGIKLWMLKKEPTESGVEKRSRIEHNLK